MYMILWVCGCGYASGLSLACTRVAILVCTVSTPCAVATAYYRAYDNFFAYGANGLKSDFGGHDNHHYRNIYAYVVRNRSRWRELIG